MNKSLHLKRAWVEEGHKYSQGLQYDLTNWTEGDLAQLNDCLNHFKKRSKGEFDFYIGEYGIPGDDLTKVDSPKGFYEAVDRAKEEAKLQNNGEPIQD